MAIDHVENQFTLIDTLFEIRNQGRVFLFSRVEEGADVSGALDVLSAQMDGSSRHSVVGEGLRSVAVHKFTSATARRQPRCRAQSALGPNNVTMAI